MAFYAGQRILSSYLNQSVQLIQKLVLTGSASSVTFSSIPQQFTNLRLVISAKGSGTTNTGYDSANLRFNGASSGYAWNSIFATQGGTPTSASATSATAMQCAEIWNSFFSSAGRGIATIDIPNYSDSNNLKSFTSSSTAGDGGTTSIMQQYSGFLGASQTAAITSLTILMNVGNFIADSTFSLYGM